MEGNEQRIDDYKLFTAVALTEINRFRDSVKYVTVTLNAVIENVSVVESTSKEILVE